MKKKSLFIIWYGFAFILAIGMSGCNGGGSSSGNIGVPNAQDVLYIANENAQTLMALDLGSGFYRTSAVGLSSLANDMQIRPDTNQIWVLHTNPAEMRKFAIQTDKTQAPVFIAQSSLDIFSGNTNPINFAFSNHGSVYYVSSSTYACVSLRDANSDNDYHDLQVGTAPEGVTVLPNGNVAVAITAYEGPIQGGGAAYGYGEVVLCDSALTTIMIRDTVGVNPRLIRYYNNALYVLCSGDFNTNLGTLWKLDPNTLQPLTPEPIIFNGAYPSDLAIDADSTGNVVGVIPAVSFTETGNQTLFLVDINGWTAEQSVAVSGDPFHVVTLPHGGTALSLFTANEVMIRLHNGTFYELRAGDGPICLAAVAK